MGRPPRVTQGGLAYHVLNRANARIQIFDRSADYEAFERVLTEAQARENMRILAYCVMPNHWHLALWPRKDGDLSRFMGWLTLTHTQRWHAHRKSAGTGHLYGGRFKSFMMQSDGHLLTVCRYVERNPLRADLVEHAQDWRWGSLWRRRRGDPHSALLSRWPIDRPQDWIRRVNQPETQAELEIVRRCATRGLPYGSGSWVRRTVDRFGLESTARAPGRPRKGS